MKIDFVSVAAIIYCIGLVMQCVRLYQTTTQKSRMSALLSGTVLFAYVTALYMTNQLIANRSILVVLSLALLQLAAFDHYQMNQTPENMRRQLVMLAFHAVFAWYYLQ